MQDECSTIPLLGQATLVHVYTRFVWKFVSLLVRILVTDQSMYNSLTQLRRMADRFTGAHHFAANSLQRQVAKLNSRFSKFESPPQ